MLTKILPPSQKRRKKQGEFTSSARCPSPAGRLLPDRKPARNLLLTPRVTITPERENNVLHTFRFHYMIKIHHRNKVHHNREYLRKLLIDHRFKKKKMVRIGASY